MTDANSFDQAKLASQYCSKMRIEVLKFTDALSEAQAIFDKRIDEYSRKPKAVEKPKPVAVEAPKKPSLSLDDFDDEPPSEADELVAELTKTNDSLLF